MGKGSSVKETWWEGWVRDGTFGNLGICRHWFQLVGTVTKGCRHDLLQQATKATRQFSRVGVWFPRLTCLGQLLHVNILSRNAVGFAWREVPYLQTT